MYKLAKLTIRIELLNEILELLTFIYSHLPADNPLFIFLSILQ